MSHLNRFYRLFVVMISCLFVFNLSLPHAALAQAAATVTKTVRPTFTPWPTRTATITKTPRPSSTPTATITPTPAVQADADPQAWVDAGTALDAFPAKGALTIQFNAQMLPGSSAAPVLVWPAVQGAAQWNDSATMLTFIPAVPLDSKKTYTFFLDPALQSAAGKTLKAAPEWVIHVQNGPQVVSVSPSAGDVTRRDPLITVHFDRAMNQASDHILTIEPAIAFDLHWKDGEKLEITLKAPLKNNTRYNLTLSGLVAADGTALDDYSWFYNAPSLTASIENWGSHAIKLKFSQLLDKEKSRFPFAFSPALNGTWEWLAADLATFTATEPILALKDYTLTFTAPLTDRDGLKTSVLAPITFSGIQPIVLLGISSIKDQDVQHVDVETQTLTVRFSLAVDHASAEKAFSLVPTIPGEFSWETSKDAKGESLIYSMNELLLTNTVYTLQIATSIKDKQGQPILAHPYQENFDNGYYPSLGLSFGEDGENVQVVDANGPRRLQIQGTAQDVNFAAYRFDLIDFAKLYADHYRERSYATAGIRNIPVPADLKSSARWTEVSKRSVGADQEKYEVYETTLPADLAPGLYILDMRVKNTLYDQLFLIVTRNTLVVKHDGQNLFVWLTNINGENVSNAEVRVYSKTGEKLREGKTDADGQYRVSIPPGSEPMLVSAHAAPAKDQPDDVTMTGFDGWGTYIPYNSGNLYYYDYYRLPVGLPYNFYAYTDRPIYRPGQQVNFKAIVRRDHDMRYEVPPVNTTVEAFLLDARNNIVESIDLHTNAFGTVNGSFTLTEGAMLGDYQISFGFVDDDLNGGSARFKVQDYRKPDYQISITSLQPEKKNLFVRGQEVKVQINASYYFGEPLAKTWLDVKFYGEHELDGNMVKGTTTDEAGNATITFEAPYDKYGDYSYYCDCYAPVQQIRMEVSAQDGSQQIVSSVYAFTVYTAGEKLNIDTGGYYASPNKPVKITSRAVDLFDQPVAGRELSLYISHWDWKTYDYEKTEQSFQLKTDADGNATQEVTLQSGYYKLNLRGKDANNNEMQTSRWLYIFKDGNDWYSRTRENAISISAEKDSYKPYEKARFLIESSFSGPALLTFERGSVINTKMIQLTAPLTIIETDVIPEHAPNVFVMVNAWQASSDQDLQYGYYGFRSIPDSRLRVARTQIKVDAGAKALNIRIQPDKQTYTPGEKVTAIIQVNDAEGKPAPAELSLAVVDESIFALADDRSGDIFNAFYGLRRSSVYTYASMEPSRYLTPMLGGGGGGGMMPNNPRSDFLDTSTWLPTIETDAKGQATVSFDLPDNTTSWRLTVKAITLNHKVGQAQTNIESKKEVFVNPSLPRVLTTGDSATLTTRVHNYGAAAQTLTVNLSAAGLDVQGPGDQQITLQPGDVQTVGWRVTVSGAKPTEVTITVTGAGGPLDAVRLPLLLQPAAVKDVQNQSGQFTGNLTLALPLPSVQRDTSLVRLTLNRSMSGTILNGLEYLTGYPYGCVEQTMSRALPNAVVSRAASQLGVGGPALQAKVAPYVKASIQKLYGLQHYDGGWGWWTDDRSDAYETAWVLYGLGLMDQAGYTVDVDAMEKAAKWLKDRIGSSSNDMDIRTQAYALYSMAEAGHGEKAITVKMATDSIQQLDTFSQAALALALDKLGEKQQAQSIMALLTKTAAKKDNQVYWPQPSYDGEYHQKTMASTIRTTALVLLAYMRIEPKNTLVPGIVTYLGEQRKGIYGWGTTNETSFTILALTEYFKVQQAEEGSTPYEVFANGKSLAQGTLEVSNPIAAFDIPLSELKDGLNSLVINTQGDRPLYYDLSTNYDLLRSNPTAAGKISVKRSYFDAESKRPITEIHTGQLVKVTLEVDIPQMASFVAVEDYLPGGLEALNEELSAVNMGASYDDYGYNYYEDLTHYYWEDYGYNYKEIRGDRVVFFITTFDAGTRKFSYYARATTAGEFTTLPTQVYAMYDQSLWGRSDSAKILIK